MSYHGFDQKSGGLSMPMLGEWISSSSSQSQPPPPPDMPVLPTPTTANAAAATAVENHRPIWQRREFKECAPRSQEPQPTATTKRKRTARKKPAATPQEAAPLAQEAMSTSTSPATGYAPTTGNFVTEPVSTYMPNTLSFTAPMPWNVAPTQQAWHTSMFANTTPPWMGLAAGMPQAIAPTQGAWCNSIPTHNGFVGMTDNFLMTPPAYPSFTAATPQGTWNPYPSIGYAANTNHMTVPTQSSFMNMLSQEEMPQDVVPAKQAWNISTSTTTGHANIVDLVSPTTPPSSVSPASPPATNKNISVPGNLPMPVLAVAQTSSSAPAPVDSPSPTIALAAPKTRIRTVAPAVERTPMFKISSAVTEAEQEAKDKELAAKKEKRQKMKAHKQYRDLDVLEKDKTRAIGMAVNKTNRYSWMPSQPEKDQQAQEEANAARLASITAQLKESGRRRKAAKRKAEEQQSAPKRAKIAHTDDGEDVVMDDAVGEAQEDQATGSPTASSAATTTSLSKDHEGEEQIHPGFAPYNEDLTLFGDAGNDDEEPPAPSTVPTTPSPIPTPTPTTTTLSEGQEGEGNTHPGYAAYMEDLALFGDDNDDDEEKSSDMELIIEGTPTPLGFVASNSPPPAALTEQDFDAMQAEIETQLARERADQSDADDDDDEEDEEESNVPPTLDVSIDDLDAQLEAEFEAELAALPNEDEDKDMSDADSEDDVSDVESVISVEE
ncbi:ATP-dependent DNA helicase [Microdochium nivale]|nr:ATP-dependent DNA helicase [Microdochium nivale]